VDAVFHVAGLLLTVLGTVYTAYPALRGRQRAPITRALAAGLAGGLPVAASIAVLALLTLGLSALAFAPASAMASFTSALPAYVQLVGASFGVGVVIGLLAGVAHAAEQPAARPWRRNAVLAAVWLALVASSYVAAALGQTALIGPSAFVIIAWSVVVGALVEPPLLGRRQRVALIVALPAGFLIVATGTRLATGTGGIKLLVAFLDATLEVLAVSVFFAVLAFVVCRPPPASDRQPSVRHFLAGAAIGLAVAVGPGIIDAVAIRAGLNLLVLMFGIGALVTVLNGEARLLAHVPRARLVVSGPRTRLVGGVALRRFRGGALVGAVLSLEHAVLTLVVLLLLPRLASPSLRNPGILLAAAAFAVPPVVLSLAIATGGLNVVVPLLVAKLERLAPEQFIVPGIVMIAAGALLVDSEALRRVLGL
jgi:hypothetical protein